MKSQLIISVGREFGSGGHEISVALAERFGLKLYDHNLLDEVAKKHNVDPNNLHKFDEKPRKLFLSRNVNGYSSSAEENITLMQFDYLKEKAKEGESFVVVGRCAETILQEYPELYQLSEIEALGKMLRHDQYRKRYHNYYCEDKWGDSRTYDLCINSSRLGIAETVNTLEAYIRKRAGLE